MPRSLRREYALSTGLILLLSIVSSLFGLTQSGYYNDPVELLPRIYAQDAVILVIAVPILAIGLWYAWRGSMRGYLIWLGSLAFMTYIWASYAFTIAYNYFFLGYIALFSLSLFTLVGGVLKLDIDSVYSTIHGRVYHRQYSGFLGFAAVGLAALWLSELVPATVSGTVPAAIETFGARASDTYVIDLGVVVPSLALTAKWLWEQRRWAYALAGILLVFTAVLAPVITAITVVDVREGVTMSFPVIVGSIIPPLIGAVFAGKYLHAVGAPRSE